MNQQFQRIERLPPYVFNIIGELKQQARARGEDIIDFGMGNPDQPTPQHIVDKLKETVDAVIRTAIHSRKVYRVCARLCVTGMHRVTTLI